MCHNNVSFLSITFDRKEIETWGRCQTVCLDETHWLICNMTYLGHFRDMTWGQISKLTFRGHVMIKIGHVAYVSMRLDERDLVTSFPRLKLYFLKVTLQKTCNFPMTSSCDLRWPFEGHWHQMTQSKPRLLLRTTQTTDCHQPHLDTSTQAGDINRKLVCVCSATYIWRYVAKNDLYRQNAFFLYVIRIHRASFGLQVKMQI